MPANSKHNLTYVLANGDEKTITLESERLFDFIKWFQDKNSGNAYDIVKGIEERITLFKDTILSVRY